MNAARERTARAAVRLLALAALLVAGVVRWLELVVDPPVAAGVAYVVAAVAVAVGLTGCRDWGARRRVVVALAATTAALAGALHAGGVPLALLDPRQWGVLAAGLADGIAAVPEITVPYRGTDAWARVTIAAGGLTLAGLAAVSAAWPRGGGRTGARGAALAAIAVLLTVPAIQLTAARPWLVGALFAVPLTAYLLAERLPLRLAAVSAGTVSAAVLAAMAVAPAIDAADPLVDVQAIAADLQRDDVDQFRWTHGYGPLDWPRDGRELLRVRARRPSYWKAQDLEVFDGVRWTIDPVPSPLTPIAEGLGEHPGWRQELRVTLAGMATRQFVAAGETLSISRAPRRPVITRPGGFSVAAGEDDLRSGSAYLAESYVPRPDAAQLRAADVDYPTHLGDQLTMQTPAAGPSPSATIRFMPFGSGLAPVAAGAGLETWEATDVLERSGYGEVYRLAQGLAATAATPYDFARRIEGHLNGPQFAYEEDAAQRRLPVPAFLLRDRAGYCQHFSAAMALLLRMGGVPARVAGGFTAGQLDAERREYVVRDLDAHSWVEVWFDGIGWVTFDPTPSDAPARVQAVDSGLADPGVVAAGESLDAEAAGPVDEEAKPERDPDPKPAGATAIAEPAADATSWRQVVGLTAVAALALGGWVLWRRRRARARPGRDGAPGVDPDAGLAELERALRRSGEAVPAGVTLLELERRHPGRPGVRAYARALAERRYSGHGDGPGRADRRALRRDLARGRGPVGRLRALWAVPPRPRLH